MPPVDVRYLSMNRAADSNRNKQTSDIISLIALRNVLRSYEIPEAYYSLNGNADSSVCISEENGVWQVFIGDRGKKRELSSYQDASDACVDVIRRVGEKNARYDMLLSFIRELTSQVSAAAYPSYSSRLSNQRRHSYLSRKSRKYAYALAKAKAEYEK